MWLNILSTETQLNNSCLVWFFFYLDVALMSMEPWSLAKWLQLLSGYIAKVHLPRVSRETRLSVNDKGDNVMIPAAAHRSPGIYLTVDENPGKSQLGDCR